jgi:bifunctional UDP-N-acetylglucosamine pyrophosphorylase/glucosamine-1-phosphate N-acetyltransferase
MIGVVLAAGEGTRMRPLTRTRPKVLLPVADRRLIDFSIEALVSVGVERLVVVTEYRAEEVERYVEDRWGGEVELSFVRQGEPLGTAHAVYVAWREVDPDESVLVTNGDLVFDPALVERTVEEHEGIASMALVEVDDPSEFGVVRLEDGYVRELVEKPDPGEAPSNLANAGVYVLEPEFGRYLEEVRLSPRGEFELTDALLAAAREEGVKGVPQDVYWLDVGRPWDLLDANEWALRNVMGRPEVEGVVEEGVELRGPVWVAEGAVLRPGTVVEGPAYIGPGCELGPNCYVRPATTLVGNVRVGQAVEIKNSIVMEGTNVSHLSYVGDSVIGAECNLGAGTVIANLRHDERNVRVVVKGELEDTGRRKFGAVLGDGVKTGINTSILPGRKLGPYAATAPGAVVRRNVPEGKMLVDDVLVDWDGRG